MAVGLLCACLPSGAQAAPLVRFGATLTPERLGHDTTIGFGAEISAPAGGVPSPSTGIEVRYPTNLSIALTGLGLQTCTALRLEVIGAGGCPPDSRMGFGKALAEIQYGPEIVSESADVEVVRAPSENRQAALLFYADAHSPMSAQIVVPGELTAAAPLYGGALRISVPLVPTFPRAPDVAIVHLSATIGPQHLIYFEQLNGRTVAYKPRGIVLPKRCPRAGFQFAADFTFQDGSHASAHTAVPCPRSRPRRRR
jgi:hypothetical protein